MLRISGSLLESSSARVYCFDRLWPGVPYLHSLVVNDCLNVGRYFKLEDHGTEKTGTFY